MKSFGTFSVRPLLLALVLAVAGLACGPQNKFCVPGKVDPKTGALGDKDGNCVERAVDSGSEATIIGDDGGATFID